LINTPEQSLNSLTTYGDVVPTFADVEARSWNSSITDDSDPILESGTNLNWARERQRKGPQHWDTLKPVKLTQLERVTSPPFPSVTPWLWCHIPSDSLWGPCNPEILPRAPSSSLRKLYSTSFRSYVHRLSVGFQPQPHKLRPSHTLSHFCQITLEAITLCTPDSCVSHSLNDLAEVSLFKLVCSEISMQVD